LKKSVERSRQLWCAQLFGLNNVSSNSSIVSPKRQKKSSVADHLICPITRELTWEPVTAEDGRIYERLAIEAHINNQGSNLRSPITKEPMGNILLPAPEYKALIESIIETGVIEADLVSKWNDVAKEKKAAKDLIEQANGGDTGAMEKVGINYELGSNGFQRDCKQAYYWYKKAHTLGHAPATANLGACLCDGVGVKKDSKLGLMYLSMAASDGSDYAAFVLGMSFAHGTYGTVKDKQEARSWLQKCLGTCDYHQMTNEMKTKARLELNRIILDEVITNARRRLSSLNGIILNDL
jgi:hypothetical protein